MGPRRQIGLGAMRQIRHELKEATRERIDIDLRIRRLKAAEAALRGARSPNAKVLSREKLRAYLLKHPGSRSLEVADGLGAPPGSVRTLLSSMKRSNEVNNDKQRWYPQNHPARR